MEDFCQELQKIHLLNDEKWLFVLSNLEMEFERRMKQLDLERQKCIYKNLNEVEMNAILNQKKKLLIDMVIFFNFLNNGGFCLELKVFFELKNKI